MLHIGLNDPILLANEFLVAGNLRSGRVQCIYKVDLGNGVIKHSPASEVRAAEPAEAALVQ